MTLGDIVKDYRNNKNISMDEFSKISSLSKGYISMLENNINPRNKKPIAPTLPTIQKIARGMNTDVDSLLKSLDGNQVIILEEASVLPKHLGIGKRIKEQRENLKITREDLSKKVGVTPAAIADYENAISFPSTELMYKLFEELNCDANYLYQDNMEIMENFNCTLTEQYHIKKYRDLDSHGTEIVDMVLDIEHKRWELEQEKSNVIAISEEIPEHTRVYAAHEHTDIEITDEMRQHDDDLMNNDDLWK